MLPGLKKKEGGDTAAGAKQGDVQEDVRHKRSLTPLAPPRKKAAAEQASVIKLEGSAEEAAGQASSSSGSTNVARIPIRSRDEWLSLSTATRLEEAGKRVAFWTAQVTKAAEELERAGDSS